MGQFPNTLTDGHRVKRCPKYLAMSHQDTRPCDLTLWKGIKRFYSPRHVYINVPYVTAYRKNLASIVATLMHVDMVPVLALNLSQGQPFRLCKLCELMQKSKYCVTDLSHGNLQNMPLELGMFIGLGRIAHSFVLTDKKFELDPVSGEKVRKHDALLSNLKSVEVIVHENNPALIADGLLQRMRGDVPESWDALDRMSLSKNRPEIVAAIMEKVPMVEKFIEERTLGEFLTLAQAAVAAKYAPPPSTPPP